MMMANEGQDLKREGFSSFTIKISHTTCATTVYVVHTVYIVCTLYIAVVASSKACHTT